MLQFATIDGANAAGLGDVTGSLVVGKAADIVVLDDRSLAMTPLNNPIGAVVYNAHPGLVRDVFVQGERVKKDGVLVGVDFDKLRADGASPRATTSSARCPRRTSTAPGTRTSRPRRRDHRGRAHRTRTVGTGRSPVAPRRGAVVAGHPRADRRASPCSRSAR